MNEIVRWVRRQLDARYVKDLLIIGGLIGAVTSTVQFYQMGRDAFGPGFLSACIALTIIGVSALLIYYVFDQLWFRYSDRRLRGERSGRTYAWRLRYAGRLCCNEFRYFAAIISMKIVRIIGGLAFSILFILMMFNVETDPRSVISLLGYELNTAAMMFVGFGFSAVATATFGLFAMWEVSIISRMVADHLARRNQREMRAAKAMRLRARQERRT